jgi:uncharacterized protein (TIGR02996 family)
VADRGNVARVTREELVVAILADPDADAPRIAFAEWAATHDPPRAELVQLQLADRDARRRYGRSVEAARSAEVLLARHGAAWAAPVSMIATEPSFGRGFVEGVTLDVPTFLARAAELYAIAPIRGVTFVDAGPYATALAASPYLERLVAIEFRNRTRPLGDDGLRALVSSPYLGKLAMLSLPFNDIGRSGVEALAAAALPRLAYVALGNNPTDNPVDEYSEDWSSGLIITNSVTRTAFGRELEARYGERAWLHAPELLRAFPPRPSDF